MTHSVIQDFLNNREDYHLPEGVRRQRRNFLLSSVLLFLYLHMGVTLDAVNILGTTINISDPNKVFWLLVIFWLYFFWRFAQYSFEYGGQFWDLMSYRRKYSSSYDIALRKRIRKNNPEVPKEFRYESTRRINVNDKPRERDTYYIVYKNKDGEEEKHKVTGKVGNKEEYIIKAGALSYVAITDPRFSDYILPYIVFFVLSIYIIIKKVVFG